ncbi:hypothetical protein Bbelb_053430 [Branchiostoma belcheri]|nr:hypothetical protein Bbelb_053430 [Branchiostoma belcheri]
MAGGVEGNYTVLWCRFENDTVAPQQEMINLDFDPTDGWHSYELKVTVGKTFAVGEDWSLELIIDGTSLVIMNGIPVFSEHARLTLSVWNRDDFVPDVQDIFTRPEATSFFRNLRFPPSTDNLCRFGDPFRPGDNSVSAFYAGVGTEKMKDDVAPFREFNCDPDCSNMDTTAFHVRIDDLTLSPNVSFKQLDGMNLTDATAVYYITVKAVSGSGRTALACSSGVQVDVTPPDIQGIDHVDMSWDDEEIVEYQGSNSTIAVRYSAFDRESQVAEYFWAIGTAPWGSDIQTFMSNGLRDLAVNSDLEGVLQHGSIYFVTLLVVNGAGLESSMTSSGVKVLLGYPNVTQMNTTVLFGEDVSDDVYPDDVVEVADLAHAGFTWERPQEEQAITSICGAGGARWCGSERAKQPRSNTALTTDNIMARGGNDNVPDLPVDDQTLGNVFREICGHRYRETFGRLMSADCYGCQVDHPSQRHHPCLFLHDDELREYGHRSLANMLFRKVYADFVGLTVYLCEQEQVPPLETMRQKYEEWRQDMQRSIDADQEKETGEEEKEGGCDNDKSGSVHPWIRDMIERELHVCVNSRDLGETDVDILSNEVATLICSYAGSWLIRHRGWEREPLRKFAVVSSHTPTSMAHLRYRYVHNHVFYITTEWTVPHVRLERSLKEGRSIQQTVVASINASDYFLLTAVFAHKRSLTRHQKSHDTTKVTHRCEICDKTFTRLYDMKRHHQQKHESAASSHECDFCGRKPAPTFSCGTCNEVFGTVRALQAHGEAAHPVPSTSREQKRGAPAAGAGPAAKRRNIQPAPGEFPYQEDPVAVSEDLIPKRMTRPPVIFTDGDDTEDTNDLTENVWAIFRDQRTVFKLSVSFGFLLRDGETGAPRYFYPSDNNNRFVEEPVLVENEDGVRLFLDRFNDVDVMERARQQRSNRDRLGPYNDKRCFFRCLALHRHCDRTNLEGATKTLFHQYLAWAGKTVKQFKGVSLKHLNDLETLFDVDIYVYALQPNDDEDAAADDFFAELVRRPLSTHNNTMYLNLYGDHFMRQEMEPPRHCEVHIRTCDGKAAREYPGGAYHLKHTIFEKLQDEGIVVAEEDRFYPYRACFDIECLLKPLSDPNTTPKLQWETVHELLSVSVASNVPGYTEPVCFVSEGEPAEVAEKLLDHLTQISQESYGLLSAKFSWIKKLEKRRKKHYMTKLMEEFEKYLKQLVVLSFNGGKYDLNAVKKVFLPLLLRSTSKLRPIKKNNNYMSIETDDLKFLDLINYVAPGFSYSILLKAYDCEETKGFFPYEWMDSLDKLDEPRLPGPDAFHSKLRDSDIEAEDYQYCLQVWEDQSMTTMRDFLVWYNNKDVGPMVDAVQKMFDFYKDLGIDMFKDGISVPGLTLKFLFMNLPSTTYFTLVDNEEVYRLFKDNIVGGPSIIFHRHHEKGKTYIRADEMKEMGREPKLCQKVVGFDANALYLWALMQDMPSGHYIRRQAETGFKPEDSAPARGRMATEWLDWVAQERDLAIRHQFNSTEKRVGPRRIPVDGFCSATGEIFQFHGCYWHGHACNLTKGRDYNERRGKSLATLREETAETTEYLRKCGYTVVEMWECEWLAMVRTDDRLSSFVAGRKTPTEHLPDMTEERVLQAVRSGQLFGAVECDIEVPANLKSHFSEMPPIFKNVDISIDDIGDYMKAYAEEHNLMSKPRRSLIGSMFGRKILLATSLLNWYLKHGLQVTRIYQVMEYRPKPSFKSFGDAVSDARRKGDEDKSKKIIADTMKLIGNSGYGKTVTNKEKQTDVEYCEDVVTATRRINTSRFRHLVVVNDEGFFEIESAKRKIKFDLPLQIGFFVYQYAKLRMLEFYYDFMLEFVDVSDFQYCEMDTDSAYIALSANSLDDVINLTCGRDTPENAAYDKRTPGLFKEEWSGNGIVGLCSKTYYCFGGEDKTHDKFSCKGVNKRCNDIDHQKYLRVLETKRSGQGINKGFRMRGNEMHTYVQIRDAFSYFYPKRKVKNDGITTLPLDI